MQAGPGRRRMQADAMQADGAQNTAALRVDGGMVIGDIDRPATDDEVTERSARRGRRSRPLRLRELLCMQFNLKPMIPRECSTHPLRA